MTEEIVFRKLNEWFGPPCDYTLSGVNIDEFMFNFYGDWCENHCPQKDYSECWKKVFLALSREGR